MLVERLELPNEGARVLRGSEIKLQSVVTNIYLEDHPHPVIDVVLHFVILTDNHLEMFLSETGNIF